MAMMATQHARVERNGFSSLEKKWVYGGLRERKGGGKKWVYCMGL